MSANARDTTSPDTASPAASPVTHESITRVVHAMGTLWNERDLQKFNGIGSLVINELFDGDWSAWRSRGKRDPTIRQLIKHKDLPISSLDLYRAIGIFEIWTNFDQLSAYPLVTATHLRNLLGMIPSEQKRWLDMIQSKKLSTRQTEQAIADERNPMPKDDRMNALVEVRTALRQLDDITNAQEGLVADLERVGLPRESLARVDALLSSLIEPLDELRNLLADHTSPKLLS